jgi:hypothetical protein
MIPYNIRTEPTMLPARLRAGAIPEMEPVFGGRFRDGALLPGREGNQLRLKMHVVTRRDKRQADSGDQMYFKF